MKKLIFLIILLLGLCSQAEARMVIAGTTGGDVTAPTLSSATIGTNGTTWTFVFSETVAIGAGGNAGWAVDMSVHGGITLTYDSGSGSDTLVYLGDKTVNVGETVSAGLNYTQPGDGIEDTAGNDLASISNASVTNNSTQDYSDILFWLTFEGTWSSPTYTMNTAGVDFSVGDTTGAATSAVVDGTSKKVGNYGLDCAGTSRKLSFTVNGGADTYGDILDTNHGRLGFWIYWTTYDATGTRNFFAAATANGIILASTATGEISATIMTRNFTTTGAGLTNGVWYFIEVYWDCVGDTYGVKVNGTTRGSGTSTIAPVDCSAGQVFNFGSLASSGTAQLYIDQMAVSNNPSRDLYDLIVTNGATNFP